MGFWEEKEEHLSHSAFLYLNLEIQHDALIEVFVSFRGCLQGIARQRPKWGEPAQLELHLKLLKYLHLKLHYLLESGFSQIN